MRRVSFLLLVLLLTVSLVLTLSPTVFRVPTAQASPGWLSGWSYRKQHIIVGSSAGNQTDYAVNITIYRGSGDDSGYIVYLPSSHVQADFDDVNFTLADGVTPLDFWNETITEGSGVDWERVVVNASYTGAHDVVIVDIDDDGKLDLVADAYQIHDVSWYEQGSNASEPSDWTKHTIDSDMYNVHDSKVGDIDGDDDFDVASVGGATHDIGYGELSWYRNNESTSVFDHKIINNTDCKNPRNLIIGDIDGQYGLDIVVGANDRSQAGWDAIILYLCPSNPYADSWSRYVLENAGTVRAPNVEISDVDNDGNPDVVAGGNYNGSIKTFIYFAPDDPTNMSGWERKELCTRKLCECGVADLNGDTYEDLVTVYNQGGDGWVEWFKSPSSDFRNMSAWSGGYNVSGVMNRIRTNCYVADFDDDEDLDIAMVISHTQSGTHANFTWHENSGDPESAWTDHVIDDEQTIVKWAHDNYAADIDDDGFTDVAGVAATANKLMWWRNTMTMATAVFWVELPEISNVTDNTIYIYYGKEDATGGGDGDATFVFFDDFNDGSVNSTKWDTYTDDGWNITEPSGELRIMGDGTSGENAYVISDSSFSSGKSLEARIKNVDGNVGGQHSLFESSSNRIHFGAPYTGTSYGAMATKAGTGSGWQAWGTTDTNYHRIQIAWTSESKFYLDDTLEKTISSTYTPTVNQPVRLKSYSFCEDHRWDWVFLRKLVDPEPTHGDWGTEQEGEDTEAPSYSNIAYNTTVNGDPCKFSCQWQDIVGLSGYIFSTNNTGSWSNDTWNDPWTGMTTSGWSNVTKTLNDTATAIHFRFWCNDTSNNWADTGVHAFAAINVSTFYSSSSDGYLVNPDGNYATARNASTASSLYNTTDYAYIGQDYTGTIYLVYRGFVYFNTTDLPDGNNIISATLSVYGEQDNSATDFNIIVQNGQPTYPHDPLENGDYNRTYYSGEGGSFPTSSFSTSSYNDIPLNSDGRSWINKSATTKLCLRSSRDIEGTQPTGDEYVSVYCYEKGSGYRPKLAVTHQPPQAAPTFNYTVTNTTVATTPCRFGVDWQDDIGLSGYIFGWNGSGSWQNDTWTDSWTGTPTSEWSNTTKTLSLTVGDFVTWQVWTNNTVDEWTTTGTKNFTVHSERELYVIHYDETGANWVEYGDFPYIDDSGTSRISASTPSHGSEYWFEFDNPVSSTVPMGVFLRVYIRAAGSSTPKLEFNVSDGASEYFVGEIYAPYRMPSPEWFQFDASNVIDTNQKLKDAELKITITTTGNIDVYKAKLIWYEGPVPYEVGTTTPQSLQSCMFHTQWKTGNSLSSYAFNHNETGSWLGENITGSLTGTLDWSNETIILNCTSNKVVAYQFWANDTNNEWETTEVQYTYVLWKHYNPDLLENLGDAGYASLAHGLGRKSFYGVNSKRFWMLWFHDNETMVYASTSDGEDWAEPKSFRDPGGGEGNFYAYYENRGGTDYVHYQFGDESSGAALYYRRGVCHTNGTITWPVAEQQVIAGISGWRIAPETLAITPSGHVFYQYGINELGSGEYRLNVTYCTTADGTWQHYSGYPKNVTGITGLREGMILAVDGDHDAYIVTGETDCVVAGREIVNDVIQSWEDISTQQLEEARCFSAFAAYGNIHVAYVGKSPLGIYYSWRNATSSSWDIQDELVTEYLTPAPAGGTYKRFSYPVTGLDVFNNKTYLNWCTREDQSAWLSIRNETAWGERIRMFRAPENKSFLVDPNIIISKSRRHDVLYSYSLYDYTKGQEEVWSYLYQVNIDFEVATDGNLTITTSTLPQLTLTATLSQTVAHSLAILSQSISNVLASLTSTTSWLIQTASTFMADLSQPIGNSWTILSKAFFTTLQSISLATTTNVLTQWTGIADLSQSMGTSWNILTESTFNVLPSLSLTASWLVLLASTFAVGLSQAIGNSWTVTSEFWIEIVNSLGLTTSWNILTKWNAVASLSQSLSTSWAILTQSTFNVLPSITSTTSWLAKAGVEYFTDLGQSLSTSWSSLTATLFNAVPSQAVSSSWTILKQWTANTGLTQAIDNSWTILAQSTFNVVPSSSLATSWTVITQSGVFVELSQALTSTWTILTEWTATVGLPQTIGNSWTILTQTTLNVLDSLGLTTSWLIEAVIPPRMFTADLAQSMSTTWTVLTGWNALASLSQSLATSWVALTQTTFNVADSLTSATSWLVDAIKYAGAFHVADLSQSISSSWNVLTQWTSIVGLSQTLSNSWNVLTAWSANANLNQSLSNSWMVLTQTTFNTIQSLTSTTSWLVEATKYAGAYFTADLSQTIGCTWNVVTQWNSIVDMSQSLSSSWNILTKTTFNVIPSLTASTSWLVEALKYAGAYYIADLTQSFSTTWTVLTQWTAIASLSQSLGTSWQVLTQSAFNVTKSLSIATSWLADIYHWEYSGVAHAVELTMSITSQWIVGAVHSLASPIAITTHGIAFIAFIIALVALALALTRHERGQQT